MDSALITPISGLYKEFYDPEPMFFWESFNGTTENGCFNTNALFWAFIFSSVNVNETIYGVIDKLVELEHVPISYKAIAKNPDAFAERVQKAKTHVADQGIDVREFFSHIETLNIFCSMYSLMHYRNFPFSIHQAWILPEESAQDIYNNCINEEKNPYLSFIKENVLPLLEKPTLKVLFISGRPCYFSFALARLLKSIKPSTFICITRHSSEYYSLNKIDFLLAKNTFLFKAFNAVILEQFSSTEHQIVNALNLGLPLDKIKNLMFINCENEINCTGYQCTNDITVPFVQRRSEYNNPSFRIPPHTIANVHLFPNVKCYWNQCNFCGINKKYHFQEPANAVATRMSHLKSLDNLYDDGVSRLWFIDEALPPDTLRMIAQHFINQGLTFKWQARCRIDEKLLECGLPKLLSDSGLRELRLGLESGSTRVLRKMNKFDDTFSFQLVEEICRMFSENGVSLHFPMIIGFPGESDDDRRMTYELLRKLTNQYPLVTFNINIYALDISSKMFSNWTDFDMLGVSFPCLPSYFLGNNLIWHNSDMGMAGLSQERDRFMREILYPWMPIQSFTQPHIFYRLSETIRNTLIWKESITESYREITSYIPSDNFIVSDMDIFYDKEKSLYYIYNWQSHRYMLGNDCVINLIEEFHEARTISDALSAFANRVSFGYSNEEIEDLLTRLISHRYLIKVEND